MKEEDPSKSRRDLITAAKKNITDEDTKKRRHSALQDLTKQGDFVTRFTPMAAGVWSTAVQPDSFKFALNAAAMDVLPHNAQSQSMAQEELQYLPSMFE